MVRGHLSYVSLRRPFSWLRNGCKYSSIKCHISPSSLLSVSFASNADNTLSGSISRKFCNGRFVNELNAISARAR